MLIFSHLLVFKNAKKSLISKRLQSWQNVAEQNNLLDNVEFFTLPRNERDSCKPTTTQHSCEIVSLIPPHTPNTFTEIDKRTTQITTHKPTSSASASKKNDSAYLQPPSRGVDDFVSGEKGTCFIISTADKGNAML